MADAALRLTEIIALLQKTCNKPIPPTRNKLPDLTPDDSRTLSIKQELDIVNCLSYLASYSDNPDRVLALCVEEKSDHEGLVVSLATNTGSTAYLEQGVRSIMEVLQCQARGPYLARTRGNGLICVDTAGDHLETLLLRVLAHGRARVVRRLGLKGSAESTTAARLEKVVHYAKGKQILASQSLQSLISLSGDFSRHSRAFRESASDGTLLTILTTASQIGKQHREDIDTILVRLVSKQWSLSIKEALKCRLGHLGHYIPATKCLLRYAQRLALFRAFEVIPVYLKPVDLSPIVNKSAINNKPVLNKHYKVHAEVQLLAHYEHIDPAYPPRILKSSKDACFLCDLFIKVHGTFHIPKTHGRVYDLWALPDMKNRNSQDRGEHTWTAVLKKFTREIEALLSKVATNKKLKLVDPTESGIFSLASTSTQRSKSSSSDSNGSLTDRSERESMSSASEADFDWLDLDIDEAEAIDGTPEETSGPQIMPATTVQPVHQIAKPDRVDSACPEMIPVVELQPGMAQIYTFDNDHTCVRFHTRKIHIEFSRSQADFLVSSSTMSRNVSDMHIHVTWLSPSQAMQAVKEWGQVIADLREHWTTMVPEEKVLLGETGLLIRNGEDLVQIKARSA